MYVHVCVYNIYIYICMYVHVYTFTYARTHTHTPFSLCVCSCGCILYTVSAYVCLSICLSVCRFVCLHACMHACMYARLYACMYAGRSIGRQASIYLPIYLSTAVDQSMNLVHLHIVTIRMLHNLRPPEAPHKPKKKTAFNLPFNRCASFGFAITLTTHWPKTQGNKS